MKFVPLCNRQHYQWVWVNLRSDFFPLSNQHNAYNFLILQAIKLRLHFRDDFLQIRTVHIFTTLIHYHVAQIPFSSSQEHQCQPSNLYLAVPSKPLGNQNFRAVLTLILLVWDVQADSTGSWANKIVILHDDLHQQ